MLAFRGIMARGIIDISKYGTERIFIQRTILVSIKITKDAFFNLKRIFAADKDFSRTYDDRSQFILDLYFNHAIVLITCGIRCFQFNHDSGTANIAARKGHAVA